MPEGNAAVLLVRVTEVLDRTRAGQQAAVELRARFLEAKERRQAITDPVEGERFELDFARQLEGERARRRDVLLVKARAAAEAIRKKKKAQLVVDASSVLAAAAATDITEDVIREVDGSTPHPPAPSPGNGRRGAGPRIP